MPKGGNITLGSKAIFLSTGICRFFCLSVFSAIKQFINTSPQFVQKIPDYCRLVNLHMLQVQPGIQQSWCKPRNLLINKKLQDLPGQSNLNLVCNQQRFKPSRNNFFFCQTLNNSHAITNRPALTKPILNAVQQHYLYLSRIQMDKIKQSLAKVERDIAIFMLQVNIRNYSSRSVYIWDSLYIQCLYIRIVAHGRCLIIELYW